MLPPSGRPRAALSLTMTRLTLALLVAPMLWFAPGRAGAQSPLAPPAQAPQRILFVGDSFTHCNGGLENHFRLLAESAQPPRVVYTERATKGGATLKILQGLEAVHAKIQTGHYDLVILQEDIPELTEHEVTPFLEHARQFDREIRGTGARTALFMAWAYERLNWVSLDTIAEAHRALAKELSLPVAPVGIALARALAARPGLAMLGQDREHQTMHGTYLAANVIYATVFGVSPAGLSYLPPGVSAEEAAFLQSIAWSAVQEWPKPR